MANEEKCRVIAEKVFGCTTTPDGRIVITDEGALKGCTFTVKNYFTDPDAMVALLDALRKVAGVSMAIFEDGSAWTELSPDRLSFHDDNIRVEASSLIVSVAEAAYQWAIRKNQ